MNDFTKDELQILRDFCLSYESEILKNKPFKYLADKLNLLIDNYCEHDKGFEPDGYKLDLCKKCGEVN